MHVVSPAYSLPHVPLDQGIFLSEYVCVNVHCLAMYLTNSTITACILVVILFYCMYVYQ